MQFFANAHDLIDLVVFAPQTKEVFEEVGERVGETLTQFREEAEELQHAFVSLFSPNGALVRHLPRPVCPVCGYAHLTHCLAAHKDPEDTPQHCVADL